MASNWNFIFELRQIRPDFAPASIMPAIVVAVADVAALLRSVVYVRHLLHRFIYNLFSLRLNNTQIGHVKAANKLQHVEKWAANAKKKLKSSQFFFKQLKFGMEIRKGY